MPDQSSAATEHAILQEIIAPLDALPDDPLATINADFPTALRGYDRVAVEEYVRKASHLVVELQATRSPDAAVRRALERVGEQITGILQRAHETAEQITAQSRREAEDRLEQARAEAAQIAGAAEQRVKDLDADTDRIWIERQRIMADAEDLAGQMLKLTRTAADRFPADEDRDDGADSEDRTLPYDQETVTEVAAPEPPARDEIDKTVAFSPLGPARDKLVTDAPVTDAPVTDAPVTDAPVPDEPRADRPGPTAPERPAGRGPSAPDESTAVIPPASQAANSRLNR